MKAVSKHTDEKWVLLYVERWLKAPIQLPDGTLVERNQGSPQGSAISPLLANIFLHHAFDQWMAEHLPYIPFERYSDDVVVHCKTQRQAEEIKGVIAERLMRCKLELHPDKTRIVYCKDSNRRGSHEHERFTFVSYTFRPRRAKSKAGKTFASFTPAVSDEAAKAKRHEIKDWRLHRQSTKTLKELAMMINIIVDGWINYYGRFYPSWFQRSLRLINEYLVRWIMKKYKQFRRRPARARRLLAQIAEREPNLFAHWRFGVLP
jgi:RNA-directed DNA polymerase